MYGVSTSSQFRLKLDWMPFNEYYSLNEKNFTNLLNFKSLISNLNKRSIRSYLHCGLWNSWLPMSAVRVANLETRWQKGNCMATKKIPAKKFPEERLWMQTKNRHSLLWNRLLGVMIHQKNLQFPFHGDCNSLPLWLQNQICLLKNFSTRLFNKFFVCFPYLI